MITLVTLFLQRRLKDTVAVLSGPDLGFLSYRQCGLPGQSGKLISTVLKPSMAEGHTEVPGERSGWGTQVFDQAGKEGKAWQSLTLGFDCLQGANQTLAAHFLDHSTGRRRQSGAWDQWCFAQLLPQNTFRKPHLSFVLLDKHPHQVPLH